MDQNILEIMEKLQEKLIQNKIKKQINKYFFYNPLRIGR